MSDWTKCIHHEANMDGVFCKDGHGLDCGRCRAFNGLDCEHCKDEPPTNADCIRKMTDEELAELLVEQTYYSGSAYFEPLYADPQGRDCKRADAVKAWLEWLKQPYTGGDNNG